MAPKDQRSPCIAQKRKLQRSCSSVVASLVAVSLLILCNESMAAGGTTSTISELISISPTRVTYAGGSAITIRGINFPNPGVYPSTIVFLLDLLDVEPVATCPVDSMSSSTTELVCLASPAFFPTAEAGVITAKALGVADPVSLFVGISVPSQSNLSTIVSNFVVSPSIAVSVQLRSVPSLLVAREVRPTSLDASQQASWTVFFAISGIDPRAWTAPSSGSLLQLSPAGLSCTIEAIPSVQLTARLPRSGFPAITSSSSILACRVPWVYGGAGEFNLSATIFSQFVGLTITSQNTLLRLASSGTAFHVRLPCVVTGIAPQTVAGGNTLVVITVTGTGFSPEKGETTVEIGNVGSGALGGGRPCSIISVTPSKVVCSGMFAPEVPSKSTSLFGGFLRKNVTDPLNPGSQLYTTGDTFFPYSDFPGTWNTTAVFIPKFTANYTFVCSATGTLQVYFASSAGAVPSLLCSSMQAQFGSVDGNFVDPTPSARSRPISLIAGTRYFMSMTIVNRVTTDTARLAMTHPSVPNASSYLTVPHMVTVSAPIQKESAGTVWFRLWINGFAVDVPTNTTRITSCASISLISIIKAVSDNSIGAISALQYLTPTMAESAADRVGGGCDWMLTFVPTVLSKRQTDNINVTVSAGPGAGSIVPTSRIVLDGRNNTDWFYYAVPADLFQSAVDITSNAAVAANTTTAVRVYVRGVLASHLGTVTAGSEPLWLSKTATTPTVTSVSPTQLSTSGLSLLVSGSFFAMAPAASVTVALQYTQVASLSYACAVTFVSNTSIQCTVPSALPGGTFQVFVNVGNIGQAVGPPLYVTQGHQSVLVIPAQGYQLGGTVMTITGVNFAISAANLAVTIAGAPCIVAAASPTQILCTTTAMLGNTTEKPVTSTSTSQTYYVRINITQNVLPSQVPKVYQNFASFTSAVAPRYSYVTVYPLLTSVFPVVVAASTGANFTVNGQLLDSTGLTVSFCLNGASCVACTMSVPPSSTQLTCSVPALQPGEYYVFAQTPSGQTNKNLTVTVVFTLDSVTPEAISPQGDVVLNLTGTGYPRDVNDSAVANLFVAIGEFPCNLLDLTSTWIICHIPPIPDSSTRLLSASFPSVVFQTPIITVAANITNQTRCALGYVFPPQYYAQAVVMGVSSPTVPYFTPFQGSRHTTFTIIGYNFAATPAVTDIAVTIGEDDCPVSFIHAPAYTPNLYIFCILDGDFIAGTVPVSIALRAYGQFPSGRPGDFQQFVAARKFTHLLLVDDVYPLIGSIGGGTFITVVGTGFAAPDFAVRVGGDLCLVSSTIAGTSVNVTTVICQTQALSRLASYSAYISVLSGGQNVTFPTPFVFDSTQTLILTKATPLTGSAGTVISLTLRSFSDPSTVGNSTTILGLKLIDLLLPMQQVGPLTFTATIPTNVSVPGFNAPLLIGLSSGQSFLSQNTALSFISYPVMNPVGSALLAPGGGTYITITGSRFARNTSVDRLRVQVCGRPCSIIFANTTRIICAAPSLQNLNTLTLSARAVGAASGPLSVTSFNENTPSTASTTLTDGDVTTMYTVARAQNIDLYVAIDVGSYLGAYILSASIFPVPGLEATLEGALVQYSADGSSWTTITTLMFIRPGWNSIALRAGSVYGEYLRLLAPTGSSSISLMEFSASGFYGAKSTTTLCPLIVRLQPPGSSEVTTCLLQPLLCSTLDASIRVGYQTGGSVYAVSTISPLFGPLIGGTTINIFGAFPSVATTAIRVIVDGQLCSVRTASANAITCVTAAKPLTTPGTGVTSVSFTGLGSAQIPEALSFRYASAWSDAASWAASGSVPSQGSDVLIPPGVCIYLDMSTPALASLTIAGSLITVDSTLQLVLTSERIIVQEGGLLSIGSASSPYSGTCRIILSSPNIYKDPHPLYGFAFLAVEGGTLQLYSLPVSTSIVRLAVTASPGDTSVSVSTVATWAAGSSIALTRSATSGDFESGVERTTIASYQIQGTTTTFNLTTPLAFNHYRCYDTSTSVDCSDEVLLLSRSISIQGDGVDTANAAHVIIRPSDATGAQPTIAIQFVEFGIVGSLDASQQYRSPIHIQNYKQTSPMTLNGISVHDSVHRGVFIEASEGITISSSVFFAIDGHAVSTDPSGLSRFLALTSNVASVIRSRGGDALASAFYFTNPALDMSGNVVSGASYAGYFFNVANVSTPRGLLGICPQSTRFGLFLQNSAHGCKVGFQLGPVWLGRSFECGSSDLALNPPVAALLISPVFFANAWKHIALQAVGSVSIRGAALLDAGLAAVGVEEVLDGSSGKAFVTVSQSYFAAHSRFVLNLEAAVPSTPLFVASPTVGVYAVFGPRSNGLILTNNTFFGYETSGGVPRAVVWACEPCSRVPVGSLPWTGGSDGFTIIASSSSVLQNNLANPQGVLVLSPPYSHLLFDVDGSLSMSNAANTSVIANVSHLSQLPGCTALPQASFWVAAAATATGFVPSSIMTCNQSYRFHHVTLLATSAPPSNTSVVTVTTSFGTTNYTVVAPRSAGVVDATGNATYVGQATVLLASGTMYDFSTLQVRRVADVIPATLGSTFGDLISTLVTVSPSVSVLEQLAVSFSQSQQPYQSVTALPRTSTLTLAALNAPIPNPSDSITASLPYFFTPPSQPSTSYTIADMSSARIIFVPGAGRYGSFILFQVELNPCKSLTTCVSAATPVTPRSYAWTDIRAWPITGTVPQDGEDAVIPEGVTITLRGATARLHKLVVQGTLLFHTRIDCSVTANYIVLLGGTIAAGNSTVPHPIPISINLVADRAVLPLALGKSTFARSGTLINYGHLLLYGYPKSTSWTTLSAILNPGTSSVVTSDVLDWGVGEEVAISSTTYDASESERGLIALQAADKRGFYMNVNTEFTHSYYSISVTDSVKIAITAQVATLNRNIVIQNGSSLGCQVILSEFGEDIAYAGETVLSNIEVSGCGVPFINSSNVDDVNLHAFSQYSTFGSNASVVLAGASKKQTVIQHSVVHDSFDRGIDAIGSSGAVITDTVVVGTYGSAISFRSGSSGNIVTDCLVMDTFLHPSILMNPATPATVCSYESLLDLNSFSGNVAAGSESEGYCLQVGSCKASLTNTGNEAHSNVNGFFASHVSTESGNQDGCILIDSIHAWKNSYMGIHSAVNADTYLQNSLSHDNHIAVHLGREGSGVNRMTATAVGGRSGVFDGEGCASTKCVAERVTDSCLERPQLVGDGVDMTQGEFGILLDAFTTKTLTATYARGPSFAAQFLLPVGDVRSVSPSSFVIDSTVMYYFYYGSDFGRCSGSFAVAPNPLQTLAIAPTSFSNTTWVVYNADAQMYLHAPSSSWQGNSFLCNGNPCDALNHVLINDLDGQLTALSQPTSVIGNYAPQSTDCAASKTWNAYYCAGRQIVRGSLLLRSLDADQRIMEPLSIRNINLGNIVMQSYQPPNCAGPASCTTDYGKRPLEFTALISLAASWDLDLATTTPPFNLELSLGQCNTQTSGVVLNIAFTNYRFLSSDLSVWTYPGGKSVSFFGISNGQHVESSEQFLSPTDTTSGMNYFDDSTQRLRVVLRCGDTIEVHQLPIGTVQFYLAMSIATFNYQQDEFLRNVSTFLSISRERVFAYSIFQDLTRLVVGIRSLDGVDFDAVASASEINSHISLLISLDGETLSSVLGVPIVAALSAAFADAIEKPIPAPGLSISMSTGLIVAITVLAFFAFISIVFAQRKAYQFVLQYKDDEERKKEEEEEALELNSEVAQGTTQVFSVDAPTAPKPPSLAERPKPMFVVNATGADRPFA